MSCPDCNKDESALAKVSADPSILVTLKDVLKAAYFVGQTFEEPDYGEAALTSNGETLSFDLKVKDATASYREKHIAWPLERLIERLEKEANNDKHE